MFRPVHELDADFERSRGDVVQLQRLRDELEAQKGNEETWALSYKVMRAWLAARKSASDAIPAPEQPALRPASAATPPRPHDLTAFLSARNITAPDQRSLYLYHVTDGEIFKLRTALENHAKSGRLDNPAKIIAAQFVLFAAEWFRRYFDGGLYSWDGIVTGIGATLSPEKRSLVVERGLAWWGRPLRRTAARHRQFLLSCVLEGGFPTRLLESREHGWLRVHLRRLVNLATTMKEPNRAEVLLRHALRDPYVPESFRKDEFRTLCAELAIAIVELRREVQDLPAMADVPASVRLDRHRPEWREDLPLVIEGAGAERLLNDLLSAPIETLGGSEARCSRLLVRADDAWHPALRLSADGPISLASELARGAARLRATPVGRLADDVTGEIALLDPPGSEGHWIARPRPATPRVPIRGYPFGAAVEVELRCENSLIGRLRWKGGDPVRGDVLTFFDESGDDETGHILTFLGSGSCRSRHSPLYVLASARHVARTTAGQQIAAQWTSIANHLFRLDAMSYVGVPGNDELFYRIEPGAATQRTQSLGFEGTSVKGLATIDGDDVYAGPPRVVKITNGIRKDARQTSNEVFWRHQNRTEWNDIARRKLQSGAIELVWRDLQSRAAHDRRRLIVLPADAKFHATALPSAHASFWLEHAGPWVLSAASNPDLAAEHHGPALEIGWVGAPRRSVDLRLNAPGYVDLAVQAPFPFKNGAFVGADGRLLPSDAVVTLDQLRGARAIVGSHGYLQVEPRSGNTRWSQVEKFSLEYPLWSLRDGLEALLSEAGDLDAEVILQIVPGFGRLRVRRYEMKFRRPEPRIAKLEPSFPAALHGLVFRWRSLIDMGETGGRDLVPLSQGEDGCDLPLDLPGPGIVYACRDRALAVRPTFVDRPAPPSDGLTPLQSAAFAAGLLGTAGEAGLMHFRGAFHNPAMVIPITLPPAAAALLVAATVKPCLAAPARWSLRLLVAIGFIGSAFHAYGIQRNMGGWRNWSQNLLNGPPLPAPPAFTALATAGLGALDLIEREG